MPVDITRVDGDGPARVLQKARRTQPHDAAANYRDLTRYEIGCLTYRECGRPPTKAQTATTMPVVMDYDLVVELLALHAESLRPVGTMTNNDADHCIH